MPEKRYGFWGTRPMRPHRTLGVEVADVDAVDEHGALGRVEQARHEVESVVLPEPVLPMIAVVWPGSDVKRDVAEHRRLGARVAEADVAAARATPGPDVGDGVGEVTTDVSVSSTSWMRSAHTAARGISAAMKVAIITAMRICMR